jgi:sodium/bile acid cotransporter 7
MILSFLQRRWFLLSLVSAIVAGLCLGWRDPDAVRTAVAPVFNGTVKSTIVIVVLLCMSITLDGGRLRHSVMHPGPVLLAVLINAVIMPLAGRLLMPLQTSEDLRVGLMIAAAVPSTLAAASVWTRRAGGNDAISLLTTIITNGLCFAITPFWLQLWLGARVALDPWEMVEMLLVTALLPITAGQVLRLVGGIGRWADRYKVPLGVVAQVGVLGIVFSAASEAGLQLHSDVGHTREHPDAFAFVVVTVSNIILHLGAMALAFALARRLKFDRADSIGAAFAASQKTLPIGVLVATNPHTFGTAYPWAVFPMLIFHTSQLFLDTAIAERLRLTAEPSRTNPPAPEATPAEPADPMVE